MTMLAFASPISVDHESPWDSGHGNMFEQGLASPSLYYPTSNHGDQRHGYYEHDTSSSTFVSAQEDETMAVTVPIIGDQIVVHSTTVDDDATNTLIVQEDNTVPPPTVILDDDNNQSLTTVNKRNRKKRAREQQQEPPSHVQHNGQTAGLPNHHHQSNGSVRARFLYLEPPIPLVAPPTTTDGANNSRTPILHLHIFENGDFADITPLSFVIGNLLSSTIMLVKLNYVNQCANNMLSGMPPAKRTLSSFADMIRGQQLAISAIAKKSPIHLGMRGINRQLSNLGPLITRLRCPDSEFVGLLFKLQMLDNERFGIILRDAGVVFGNLTHALEMLFQNENRFHLLTAASEMPPTAATTTTTVTTMTVMPSSIDVTLSDLYGNKTSAYASCLFGPIESRNPDTSRAFIHLACHIPVSPLPPLGDNNNGVEEYVYIASRAMPSFGMFLERVVFEHYVAPFVQRLAHHLLSRLEQLGRELIYRRSTRGMLATLNCCWATWIN